MAHVKPEAVSLGEMRADVRLVFRRERVWSTFEDGKAKYGSGWCIHRFSVKRLQTSIAKVVIPPEFSTGGFFGMLEPCEGKLSRTVLRVSFWDG